MVDVRWYPQQIPRELRRREALVALRIFVSFAMVFPATYVIVGLATGDFGPTRMFWLFVVALPLAMFLVFALLQRGTRPRDVSKVGISPEGVALQFADGGVTDLPSDAMESVECFSKEDFYGLIDPCSLHYRDTRGRARSVLLLKEPGKAIQKDLWRRQFRKQREPSEPVARPGFSESDYAPPPWAGDGLTVSYQEGGDRLWYRIARRGPEVVLLSRVDWSPRFIEEEKELYDTLYADPAAFEIWTEVEREWAETPLRTWQESRYGEFFINVRRAPEAQWVLERPAKLVERGSFTFRGTRHRALRFDTTTETDCHCTWMPKLPPDSLLVAMFVRGVGRKLRPGTCPTCQGGFLQRRSCKDCGGTGKHTKCKGTGTDRYESRNWYEERTGILLRWETWKEGKLVGTRELESLEPDVLPRA